MNIIVTALMTNGTIQAKLEPLSRVDGINKIYFLRKKEGPKIDKVSYIVLPGLCNYPFFNVLLTPLWLIYYTMKYQASFIVSYHVIPYAFIASIGSFLTKRPYIICQTGLYIQKYSEHKLFWKLLKFVILRAKMLCVPGTNSFNYWTCRGIPSSKINILHSTIDTDKYKPDDNIKKRYDFIYVGRIAKEKRLEFLIRAFSGVCLNYPGAKLLIVGDGPLINEVTGLVNTLRLNENVVYAGYNDVVLPFLHQSKSIVITSESEGLPCAIMEGMSTGLIPITTKVGNLPDIVIDDETGYCSDKNSVEKFSENMNLIMKLDGDDLNKMRRNARQIIVDEHSYNFVISKWEDIINKYASHTCR